MANDIVLRFEYPTNTNADPRTLRVNQIVEGSAAPSELYKVPTRPQAPEAPAALCGAGIGCVCAQSFANRAHARPQFHHPNTGLTTGETTFQRKNMETKLWDNAGHIEWLSNTSGAVYFGVERVSAAVCCAVLPDVIFECARSSPPARRRASIAHS